MNVKVKVEVKVNREVKGEVKLKVKVNREVKVKVE
jgi:hypothetical protein